MKYIIKTLLTTILIINSHQQYASDNVITMYFHKFPYFAPPSAADQYDHETTSKKLQQPGYLTGQIVKHHQFRKGVPGVMALYQGHVATTDTKGQIIFPLKQYKDNSTIIYLLVTKSIKPAYMIAPATVHNWQIDPKSQSQMYLIQLKQDAQTALYYFETTPIQLPINNNIPLNTIIIISDPANIFVPIGATITDYSANFILPNIYIKRPFCFVYNSMYTLAIKQYYAQNITTVKQESLTVSQIQQPNNY